jgi:hypothetical protein
MDPARQLAKFVERVHELVARARDDRCDFGVVREPAFGEPQLERE